MPLVSPAVASDAAPRPEPIDQYARASTSCAIGGHAGGCRRFGALSAIGRKRDDPPQAPIGEKRRRTEQLALKRFGCAALALAVTATTVSREIRKSCIEGAVVGSRRWTHHRPSWRVGSSHRLHYQSPQGHEAREGIPIVAPATLRGICSPCSTRRPAGCAGRLHLAAGGKPKHTSARPPYAHGCRLNRARTFLRPPQGT